MVYHGLHPPTPGLLS
jgi:hypothetical protein